MEFGFVFIHGKFLGVQVFGLGQQGNVNKHISILTDYISPTRFHFSSSSNRLLCKQFTQFWNGSFHSPS